MSSLLPLPPGLAHGLPWRVNFRTTREPAPLTAFAEPAFVRALSPTELEHVEAVLQTLLQKMLRTGKLPRRIARLKITKEASQKVFDAHGAGAAGATLSNLRYTVADASSLIGDSVAKLVKFIDPAAPLPGASQSGFVESDYEDIGHHGAAPSAVGGPKMRKPRDAGAAVSIDTSRPDGAIARRKRENTALRMLATSGAEIQGNDFRLGWLLAEAHKVVALDQRPVECTHVIEQLRSSRVPGARDLSTMLAEKIVRIERSNVADEVRDILLRVHAEAKEPGAWTEEALLRVFGVGAGAGHFDAAFWSTGNRARLPKLRRLDQMIEVLAARTLYSPALDLLRHELSRIVFMGGRRLQGRLGPLMGDANAIGVCRFVTEVLSTKVGRLVHVPVTNERGVESDLYYWTNEEFDARIVLEICIAARTLTTAQGAFQLVDVMSAANVLALVDAEISSSRCADVLNEWSDVRWLAQDGWGVVGDQPDLTRLTETMLHVVYPKPLRVNDAVEALERSLRTHAAIQDARARTGKTSLAPPEVILEALCGPGNVKRASTTSMVLRSRPDDNYWDWHHFERRTIDYLRSVGGEALNRDLCRQFKGDKGYELQAYTSALKIWPFVYSPRPTKTALRPWAMI